MKLPFDAVHTLVSKAPALKELAGTFNDAGHASALSHAASTLEDLSL
jgi:hypothetical protein